MNILFIFSFKTSLKIWESSGALKREFMYFEKLFMNNNIKHQLFTYGDFSDFNVTSTEYTTIYPLFSFFKKTNSKLYTFFLSLMFPFRVRHIFRNVDVIKVNQLSGAIVGLIFSIILKKPLYIRTGYDAYLFSKKDNKSFFKQLYYYTLTQISILFCDIYSVTSHDDYEFISNNYMFRKSKLLLRPNWVFIDTKNISQKRNNKTILSVGRLENQKNFEYLINELQNTGFQLHIIGSGSLKKHLEEHAAVVGVKLEILERLNYEQLLEKLKSYQYFALPSTYEGNPKVLLEAMSSGCVVLASNIPNHSEIIEDGVNGVLFELEEDSLNRRLLKIHEQNKYLEKLSKNAFFEVQEKFSIENAALVEYKDLKGMLS